MLATLGTAISDTLFPIPRPRQPLRLPPFLPLPWLLPQVAGKIQAEILPQWLNPDHPRYLSNAFLHRGGSGRPAPRGSPITPPTTHHHDPPTIYQPLRDNAELPQVSLNKKWVRQLHLTIPIRRTIIDTVDWQLTEATLR